MTASISKPFRSCTLLLVFLSAFAIHANAQFSSGSTGTDGALDYSNLPANTTVIFDPGQFNPSVHTPGLYVYNFTHINIPAGITVVLSGQLIKGPVFWLSQGDVQINGSILVSGQAGAAATIDTSLRVPAVPGPGGFVGGIGGDQAFAAQLGDGPLGGAPWSAGCNCSALDGGFSGNILFAPPIGGSGGGGGACTNGSATMFGGGGGAGGGALVIASSTTILLGGTINAAGGSAGATSCNQPGGGGPGQPGGGAGGAVKLAANTITGGSSGQIFAGRGASTANHVSGSNGAIRLEAFQISIPVTFTTDVQMTQADPGALFIPNQPVAIQVISVAGVALPNEPSGNFTSPDVVINSGSPVTVAIQTSGIPPGTVLTLNIYSEDGTTQAVQTTALQGTVQLATATASVTFPPDLSLGYVKATWTTQ